MVDTAHLGRASCCCRPSYRRQFPVIIARAREVGLVTYGVFVATRIASALKPASTRSRKWIATSSASFPTNCSARSPTIPMDPEPARLRLLRARPPTDLRLRNYAHFLARITPAHASFSLY